MPLHPVSRGSADHSCDISMRVMMMAAARRFLFIATYPVTTPLRTAQAIWLKRAMRKRIVILAACLAATFSGYAALRFQERTRLVEGTWLWQFEGSDFFEERAPGRECELYTHVPSWLEYSPKAGYVDYTYKRDWPSSGIYDSRRYGPYRIEAFQIAFRGRKRFSLFGAGHLGGWKSDFVVDQMITVRPIPNLNCRVP